MATPNIAWAETFYEAVRAETTFLDVDILHLWHGDIWEALRSRLEGLQRFRFDPCADVAITETGAWRWNSDKGEMRARICQYLASRGEDGWWRPQRGATTTSTCNNRE